MYVRIRLCVDQILLLGSYKRLRLCINGAPSQSDLVTDLGLDVDATGSEGIGGCEPFSTAQPRHSQPDPSTRLSV